MEYIKDFLKNLQVEMNNQDKYGQEDPAYWVVKDIFRTYYNANEDNYTGMEVIYQDEVIAVSLEELASFFAQRHNNLKVNFIGDDDFERVEILDSTGIRKPFYLFESLVDYAYKRLGYREKELYIRYYIEENKIVEGTLFLTRQECERHIEANIHNYRDPMPFVTTANRSPQLQTLYKILKGTNWDEF